MNNKKILVTGGAGYIGSHIVNLLSQTNHEVVVYDNLSTGRKESVVHGELVIGDLEDLGKLEALISERKFDAVFHFAGSIVVTESMQMPIEYYENNSNNSLNLIKLCKKYNINNFIFSSTAAVYGDIDGGICSEETPKDPISPYGRSKLMTEWVLEDLSSAKSDFKYVALRYFNVSGASLDGKVGQCSPISTHLIKIATEVALGKKDKMFIFGEDYNTPDGTCVRDYLHVDDLAQAHFLALNYLLDGGDSIALNCGYQKGYSVKEIIEIVKKVSGVQFKVELGERRAGDPAKLLAKAEKIGEVLGWKPKYQDLEIIIKSALDWEKQLK